MQRRGFRSETAASELPRKRYAQELRSKNKMMSLKSSVNKLAGLGVAALLGLAATTAQAGLS